jgi:predicted  nucleic acid-binding Zn-ribbon protein
MPKRTSSPSKMKVPRKVHCSKCGDEYPRGRAKLGYSTCLKCGAKEAKKETESKFKQSAPAYNKGPYMYITNKDMAKSIGRKAG